MVLLLCCVFDVVGLAAGAWFAFRLPSGGAGREVLRCLGFATGAMLAIALVLLPFGGFAVLRGYVHAIACVLLPLLALRGLRVRHESPRLCATAMVLALSGEGLYLWAREVEPFRLEVTTARIASPRLAGMSQPVRVAAVADLQLEHMGAYEVSVFDRLVTEAPDLVLFLGDYIQLPAEGFARELPRLHEQLARLSPPLGMFAVDGDVDQPGGAAAVFAGTRVRVLDNASVELPGVPIVVHGLDRMRSRAPFVDAAIVRRLHGDRYPIVMGHAPDFMQSVLRDGLQADALMVAGHTHGGQVQVPGFGPLITLSGVPRWLAGGGVFRHGETWLCCSRGIGMERASAPRIRFWCRPQLLLLELGGP